VSQVVRIPLVLDQWVRDVLVDPLDGSALTLDAVGAHSAFNSYPHVDGIPDFRVGQVPQAADWAEAQESFETSIHKWLNRPDSEFEKEIEQDTPMYLRHPLVGRTLDVGGQAGQIRLYCRNVEYLSLDPFITVPRVFAQYPNAVRRYQLEKPLNFIGGVAEYLPLREGSCDTVNMRSCIDHFADASAALFEARRVLRESGRLVVGSSVGRDSRLVSAARVLLGRRDDHIWHPESPDHLMRFVEGHGFSCADWCFQPAYGERVVYCTFVKAKGFKPGTSRAAG